MKVNESGKTVLDDISLNIHEGEVVGIAVSRATDRVISPMCFQEWADSIRNRGIKRKQHRRKDVHEIRQMGLAYIPEGPYGVRMCG